MELFLDFLTKGLETGAPIAFAALGAVFSERGGVVNIALEGIMLTSAFAIVWGALAFQGIAAGLLLAVLAGMLIALVHAVVTITYKVDQIVSGVAINILAQGITRFLSQNLFAQETQSALNPYLFPRWLGINAFAFVLIPLTALAWFVLYKTVFGIRLRTVGENPAAADTLGIDVVGLRYAGVLLSGAFCGLSAAVLYPSHDGRPRLHRARGHDLWPVAPGGRGAGGAPLWLRGHLSHHVRGPHLDPEPVCADVPVRARHRGPGRHGGPRARSRSGRHPVRQGRGLAAGTGRTVGAAAAKGWYSQA